MNTLTVDQMRNSVTFANLAAANAAGYLNADSLEIKYRGVTVESQPDTYQTTPDGTPGAYSLIAIAAGVLPTFDAYNAMTVRPEDLGLTDGEFAVSTPVWFTNDPTCRMKLMYAPGTIERAKSRIDAINTAITAK